MQPEIKNNEEDGSNDCKKTLKKEKETHSRGEKSHQCRKAGRQQIRGSRQKTPRRSLGERPDADAMRYLLDTNAYIYWTTYLCSKFLRIMPRRETLNNANRAKIMTDSFGHDNIFAISLSLSLRRSPTREVATPFVSRAGRPRQYTAFLGTNQEKPDCFFVPVGRRRRGRQERITNIFKLIFSNTFKQF